MNKFRYAIRGFVIGLSDRSIRLQWLLAMVAILFFSWLQISKLEWILVMLSIGLVLVSEYFNTVIEEIMNFQHNQRNPHIRNIKDLSAGAVLVAAIIAAGVGVMIVLSHVSP